MPKDLQMSLLDVNSLKLLILRLGQQATKLRIPTGPSLVYLVLDIRVNSTTDILQTFR